MGCFAWCLVDSRDMEEISWDNSCLSARRLSLDLHILVGFRCHIWGSWIGYSACVTCFLAAWGSSCRSLLSHYANHPPKTCVIDRWTKVEERVSSSFDWHKVSYSWFQTRVTIHLPKGACQWRLKLAWWWLALPRDLQFSLKKSRAYNRFQWITAQVLGLWSSWQNVSAPINFDSFETRSKRIWLEVE